MRPNTYSQFYVQIVFAVKNREALIKREWKDELEMFITGIIQNNGHKLLAIGTMPDHIHIFIGYNLNQLISVLVDKIKTSSNEWINSKKLTPKKFEWQKGYGAFSYSRSHIDRVVKYILNQESHHAKKTFKQEYLELLKNYEIDYKEEYVFEFFEEITSWESH